MTGTQMLTHCRVSLMPHSSFQPARIQLRAIFSSHIAAAALGVALMTSCGFAVAQDAPASAPVATSGPQPVARTELRVCQDPNNLPFSNEKGQGIENKIAELFGKALNLPVTYYSFPQRMAFFRNTLRYKLPGQDFRCDIVMGVPAGLDEVNVTKPYYRSTYALVFAKGKGMDNVKSVDDFLHLDPARLHALKIGVYDRSPASDWLNRHNLLEQGVPYQTMNADPDQYPGEIIERDLANGKIDATIVWGPIAGFFAKRVQSPQLVVIPMRSEPGVRFDYQMAMGVRYGEREWKKQVESLIDTQQAGIQAILKEYNVPVVDESYALRPVAAQ